MKRRDLFKAMSLLGGLAMMPTLTRKGFLSGANAAVSPRALFNAQQILKGEIPWEVPSVMPQVINIFLYGGPSELAGNLSNIVEINAESQNKYRPDIITPLSFKNNDQSGQISTNNFWYSAGGKQMDEMINRNSFSIYRTMNRVLDDSRSHRPSIFSNLTGQVGEDDSRPGMATVIAGFLYANGILNDNSNFPFVSFEGDSIVFNQGNLDLPPMLRPLTLSDQGKSPYARPDIFQGALNADILALANKTYDAKASSRFGKVKDALSNRQSMESFADKVFTAAVPTFEDPDNAGQTVSYDADNNEFGRRLGKAVTLLLNSPDTLFVSLGSSGLGGWDDHDNALGSYQSRMSKLMKAIQIADKHIRSVQNSNSGLKNRIIINVMGDFGRNTNLNNSLGWDHGNNQNFYTAGGLDIPGRQLGKIVGKTRLKVEGNGRLFTSPTSDSYQFEPFSVASTVYKYFGVTAPELLTGVPPINEAAPNEKV